MWRRSRKIDFRSHRAIQRLRMVRDRLRQEGIKLGHFGSVIVILRWRQRFERCERKQRRKGFERHEREHERNKERRQAQVRRLGQEAEEGLVGSIQSNLFISGYRSRDAQAANQSHLQGLGLRDISGAPITTVRRRGSSSSGSSASTSKSIPRLTAASYAGSLKK